MFPENAKVEVEYKGKFVEMNVLKKIIQKEKIKVYIISFLCGYIVGVTMSLIMKGLL